MPNQEIRNFIKNSRVRIWEVAKVLNVSEITIYRWLREELSEERKEAIFKAVQVVKDSM